MHFFLLIFISFSSITLYGQSVYSWKLTKDDGLPSNEIYGLFQDSKGNLWIGTDGGVCYYDGVTVHTYNNEFQTSNSNAHILEDYLGRIWFKNFNLKLFVNVVGY